MNLPRSFEIKKVFFLTQKSRSEFFPNIPTNWTCSVKQPFDKKMFYSLVKILIAAGYLDWSSIFVDFMKLASFIYKCCIKNYLFDVLDSNVLWRKLLLRITIIATRFHRILPFQNLSAVATLYLWYYSTTILSNFASVKLWKTNCKNF